MPNYNSKLQLNNTTLQTILSKINDLPEESSGIELPELSNEGSAADLLSGKELIDSDGKVVTGTIPTKTATDLAANGATVTVPAGYYATQATKSVATATRADTTISVTADDTNDKLTITGSNNQTTGYVTGANKTASTAVTLTANGKTVTATATNGTKVSKDVSTATRANTTLAVTVDDAADTIKIDASNNQATGYVTGSNETATTTVTLTASGNTVTATETGGKKVSKAVASGSATTPATTITSTPTISIDANGNITASNSKTQSITPTVTAGYVSSGTAGTITVSGSATKQLTTQAAKTITPSTSLQTAVASGRYTTGNITVEAIPSKYKDTSDATASESTTFIGETFYANGEKKTGTFTISEEMSTQNDLIGQIQTALANKAQASPVLQTKSVTPSATQQTVVADSGYDGLKRVVVSGDSNLVSENIAEGINIFGVVGSYSGGSGGGSSDNEILLLTREITTYSNPTITTLGINAFNSCAKLTNINLPSLTTMGASALMECTKLTEVTLPSLTAVPNSGFRRCLALAKADFANATSIAAYAFYQCTHLETLILRSNSVCTLANTTTALNETLIVKGTGYVYVPSALIESYKAATNWTTYADRFRAIEDYPDICG